ncbi:MAG TPA: ferritin family protein [Atribacter sp.]|uniref:Rubrerythrin n=1 Tax=Candidatus Atribacter allofermentans TaxID=1852833 RepID=A0A1V5SIG2_9BACT|nr:ferritin family protein [Atribacter sp.]MDD3714015.1 ferritin family protein [Atribacterota bacterium]OQA54330.1 MAG: Rubrerythrin [Candidatus Atribacteria bacterium ADurb.Bin276]HQK83723.1 ferritin family protein [Atribacter sp.]
MTDLTVFELALQNKNDIYKFYLEKSNQLLNLLSKEIFKKIIEDESFHLQRIQEGYEQIKKGELFTNGSREGLRKSSRECFDSIFSEIVQDQTQSSSLLLTEIEIIDQAMALETSIHRFFVTIEKEIDDQKIKDFLSFLAGEEYRHFNLLFNTREYLNGLQELFPQCSQD